MLKAGALLTTLGKLFESLMCKRMVEELSDKISVEQHGFLSGHSTTTNLSEFVTRTLHAIESKYQVDVAYTDIQNATLPPDEQKNSCCRVV